MPRKPRDQRPFNVKYYAANRETELARVKVRYDTGVELLRRLRDVPCADCGGRFAPYVMDFDHRDPAQKEFDVMRRAGSVAHRRLMAEVAKCDIVCANYHRVRTCNAFKAGTIRAPALRRRIAPLTREQERARAKWEAFRSRRSDLTRALREVPCGDCGGEFPWFIMEFDHRDPSAKAGCVMEIAAHVSLRRLLDEVAKCDIVCPNCHRVRTYRQREERGSSSARQSAWPPTRMSRVRIPSPAQNATTTIQLRLIKERRARYAA